MSLPLFDHKNVFQTGLNESRLIFKSRGSSRSRAAARGVARQAASSGASKAAAAASSSRAAAAAAASRSQQVAAQRKAQAATTAAKAAQQKAAAQAAARAQSRAQATAAANKAAAAARVEARRTARIQKQAAPSWIGMPNPKVAPTVAKPAVNPERLRALGVDDAISERTLRMLNDADPQMAGKIERLLPLVGNFDLLSADERASFFNQITSIANDNVDEPWDNKLERARRVMSNAITSAEAAFNRLQDNEKEKLKQAITGLDNEVSDNLQVGIDQLNRRGALSGGLFQRLANELLTARESEAQRLQNISDLNVKSAQTQKDLAQKEASFTLEDLTGEIGDNRKAARETEFNDLLNNLVSLDVLKQKASMEALDSAEQGGISKSNPLATKPMTPVKRTVEQIRTQPIDTSGLSRARPVTTRVASNKLTSKNSTAQQRKAARLSARQARLSAASLR